MATRDILVIGREAEEHSSIIRQLVLTDKKDDIGEPVLQGDD